MAPQVLMANPEADRAQWKRLRDGKLTASRLAAALGFSARMDPLTLWLYMTHREEEPEMTGARIKGGRHLEQGIANWWAEEYEAQLEPSPGLLQSARYPWFQGTPDFGIKPSKARPKHGVLEVKNVDRAGRDEWMAAIPDGYFIQLQGYFELWEREHGCFAVCFGGNDLAPFIVMRDDAFIDQLMAAGERWYEKHIVRGMEPPVTATDDSMRAFRKLHPRDNGQIVALDTPQDIEYAARLEEVQKAGKACELEEKQLKAHFMARIGDASFGRLPNGSGYSHKHSVFNHQAKEAYVEDRRTFRSAKKV